MDCSLTKSSLWGTVSKALLWSKYTVHISRPSSSHWCYWSVAARSALVVDLPLVNPHWLSERRQYCCRWSRTFCVLNTCLNFSPILTITTNSFLCSITEIQWERAMNNHYCIVIDNDMILMLILTLVMLSGVHEYRLLIWVKWFSMLCHAMPCHVTHIQIGSTPFYTLLSFVFTL